jgi:hypothetical protein
MNNPDLEELKGIVREYRDIDNQIREINKNVYNLREQRKIKEMEIADILKTAQFQHHKILALEDGSKIRIQRPNEWSKSWSLSVKDLLNLLHSYFEGRNNPNASDCFGFIVEEHKKKLTTNEFKLTRIVEDENVENE